MDYFKIKRILRESRRISLTDSEKSALRADFLTKSGLSESDLLTATEYRYKVIFRAVAFHTVGIVATMALTITPITWAAEKSLPGDLFYPIKTVINEPMRRVTNTALDKDPVDFEIKLLEEKIAEVDKLIDDNILEDDDRKAKSKKAIVSQVERSQKILQKALGLEITGNKDEDEEEDDNDKKIVKVVEPVDSDVNSNANIDTDKDNDTNDTEDNNDKRNDDEKEEDDEEDNKSDNDEDKDETDRDDKDEDNNKKNNKKSHGKDTVDKVLEKHSKTLEKVGISSKKDLDRKD